MKFIKPDGVIEFGTSACCCPPGSNRSGMHTNSTTSWWRIDNGEWQKTFRMSRTLETAQKSMTCKLFMEVMDNISQNTSSIFRRFK